MKVDAELTRWNMSAVQDIVSDDDDNGDDPKSDINAVDDESPEVSSMSSPASRARPARIVGARRMRLKRGLTMDSGASANVMPKKMTIDPKRIRPSPGSRAGVKYVVANDGVIKNEGEYEMEFQTKEGQNKMVVMQIAEVNKALASVAYFVDGGHYVLFDKDMNTGEDKSVLVDKRTGEVTKLIRRKNVWQLDVFAEVNTGFSRPGPR